VNVLLSPLVLFPAAVLIAAAGVAIGWRAGRRATRTTVAPANPSTTAAVSTDERALLRAAALDSFADAVLITDRDGRIRDCNSSALTLFNRHRGEVEDQFATSVRRFDGVDQTEPHRAASEHSVWVGEGWARLPDGGMKLCQLRVMAIRDSRARVMAFAESFREVAQSRDLEQEIRDLVYGVRAFEATGTHDEQVAAVRDDLRTLSEGFRDLDHVLRQYERLLPSLGADDPLTESIAGVAHDARAAGAAVGVNALLQEIPRALARLRRHLPALSDASSTSDPEPAVASSRKPASLDSRDS
jgi:hypothetical protein